MPPRRTLAAAASAAVGLGGLAVVATPSPALAEPDGSAVVISEVYGGGGSSNPAASYNRDFVEIYNPTGASVDLSAMKLVYRNAGGTFNSNAVALTGTVAAGDTYTVAVSSASAGGAALPAETIDQSATAISASATDGTIMLLPAATVPADVPNGDVAQSTSVIDVVGYGSATTREGTAAPAASITTSAARKVSATDTDVNADDFAAAGPTPDAAQTGGGTDPEPEEPTEATIAEIQGTDTNTSPLANDEVVTEGVVTAVYDTGGFNGFYLQTGGTGGATDATPGASDGVFVYGGGSFTNYPELGDDVEVTGPVSEYQGTTEITVANADVTAADTDLPDVTPLAEPWSALDSDAEKEAHEGELIAPQGDFTVSDNYDTNYYASFLLAAGDTPLLQPTDVADAQDEQAIAAVTAENARRAITLDDGASVNFNSNANKGIPLPWLSNDNPVRADSAVTFEAPVVLEYRNSAWNFQPQHRVTDEGTDVATFENTRTEAPEEVGGTGRLATFNVLNYFPTTGEDIEAAGGSCSYYSDRAGEPVTVNTCGDHGPRGAADEEDLQRQQDKIVAAINALGASVVSLEEIENSAAMGVSSAGDLGLDRDYALSTLVDALNADAGAGTWDFVPSPPADELPPIGEQDVIRTAFIYQPDGVKPVGESVVLDDAAFDNAREPLAQGFKAVGSDRDEAFAVIVNHFKSKGSGTDDGTGQGLSNPDRVEQAEALSSFADDFSADLAGSGAVFLTGDFNSYTEEDPLQVLYDDGYDNLESTTDPDETTYSFDGLAGSLDHVLANDRAASLVTGVDIWNINADESIAFEYSRYNYNASDLYEPTPYRASDHDPEVVGLVLGSPVPTEPTQVFLRTPAKVKTGQRARLSIVVRAFGGGGGQAPTGTVKVKATGAPAKSYRLDRNGRAQVLLPAYKMPGTKIVTVVYSGDDDHPRASNRDSFRVVRKKR